MAPRTIETGRLDIDIDAREAQVVGGIPRIAPITPDEPSDEIREVCRQIREVFGVFDNSEIPEMFAIMMKNPGLYQRQMEMSIQLNRDGTISARDRELAILRTAWLCRAPFEWGEHVECGKAVGITPAEIERVTAGSAAPGWSVHDAAILRAVEELLGDQSISDTVWATLAESWDDRQLLELPVLVGQYFSTALVQHSMRFALNDSNSGLRHR